MSDIVERLNMIRGTQFTPIEDALVAEAAATITDLRAEVAQMRDTLERIGTEVHVPLGLLPDADQPNGWRDVAIERGNIARAALTQTKDTTDDA